MPYRKREGLGVLTIALVALAACHRNQPLFTPVDPATSGIHFNNLVTENDSVNPLDLEFLYNGGGVSVADFNQDGLPDLYFTGSTVSNRLYLNRGDFRFEDVTEVAGVGGEYRWCNGSTVVDINNDGLPDIYVCTTIKKDPRQRTNLLYINQGKNAAGIPVFREMAAEYGLADTSHSVQAAFFDYDHDGDLDMYLATTKPVQRDVAQFNSNGRIVDSISIDKLFRNDWNDSLKHPVFTDVSKAAGIVAPGYALGLGVADLNGDGWDDIYVSNDFLSSDHCYLNNHDGTFTNRIQTCFKHTSQNAMGNDIADINNDGLPDMMTVDMNPAGNLRKKVNLNNPNYVSFLNMLLNGYEIQYVRNTLQLNLGPRVNGEDSIGDPVFADIAFFAGVAETDWSWNPSIADFDNDGWRDIIVTNGYPKDVMDHDFAAYRSKFDNIVSKKDLLTLIPQVKIPNYAFRNDGSGLRFTDVSKAWGLAVPSYSSGAVYADLDGDGDLDYVVNNINDEAFVYRNNTNSPGKKNTHWLDLSFRGEGRHRDGFGASCTLWCGGRKQFAEYQPTRGYLSSIYGGVHFGLDTARRVDSLLIRWPGGKTQRLRDVRIDTTLLVEEKNAAPDSAAHPDFARDALLTDVTGADSLRYVAAEEDYIDFDVEKLLPHKLSQFGPPIAAGDLNGDGYDDLVVGVAAGHRNQFAFLQQPDGRFVEKELPVLEGPDVRRPENMGLLLFDADGDGDLDLYASSGSNQFPAGTRNYQDRLLINDGHGNFSYDTLALPENHVSKSCVKAADIDHDGDLDLFVGGRVYPGKYPLPVSSCILRNDSKPGAPHFTDITKSVAPMLDSIGMICDASFTDFDGDGWTDLILVGEWMSVKFLRNNHGKFEDVTAASGLSGHTGWWTGIAAGDLDNDGDIDYVVGNQGLNSFYRASQAYPMSIHAKDIDGNQSLDAIIGIFLPDADGNMREYPAAMRDDILKQLPSIRKKYPDYKSYGNATLDQLFTEEQWKGALVLHANDFRSAWIENLGGGRFALHPLPDMAQLAPLYGMEITDLDGDGNPDIVAVTNDFGPEVGTGRYDALNGLVLLGDGKGGFSPQSILKSGFFVPGDGKALAAFSGAHGERLFCASQNRGPLKLFRANRQSAIVRAQPGDSYAEITLANGRKRRQEFYYGDAFLSQSARQVVVGPAVRSVEVVDAKGKRRVVYPSGNP